MRQKKRSVPRSDTDAVQLELSDLGNAERLVRRSGEDIRFCSPLRSWFLWDGSRWARDDRQRIMVLAGRTARSIYHEAADVEDSKVADEISKHALRSASAARLSAMAKLAESRPQVAIAPDQLDTDEWVLNVHNGTLDLRTGELKSHSRADLITKLAPVDYDPRAGSDLWDDFLRQATNGDSEMEGFLRRCVGYTLTGDTREDRLFFVHGPTGSGKSTFINALRVTMGDYAIQTSFETFLAKKFAGGATNDIADLVGARLVVSIEVDEGKKLAEAMVKQITGGDSVRARQLYQTNFEFRPQLKLWLVANHKPRVSDEDDAIWRRILRIPFENSLPEDRRDKTVRLRLTDPSISGSAILTWAVRGCIEWQEQGLAVRDIVKARTAEYRAEMDPLSDFLSEECEVIAGAQVTKADLWTRYLSWAKGNSLRFPLTRRAFSVRIAATLGVEAARIHAGTWVWRGIRLLSTPPYMESSRLGQGLGQRSADGGDGPG